jgi:uncharacterized protein YeaO (DUF488 family)
MPISIVRFGWPRAPNEGLRIGTVRRPPRGIRKEDWARRDYFDVWLPELAPSAELVARAKSANSDPKEWKRFAADYRREMRAPETQRLLDVLVALSGTTRFAVGCYCENEERCHRSVLRELLAEAGAEIV